MSDNSKKSPNKFRFIIGGTMGLAVFIILAAFDYVLLALLFAAAAFFVGFFFGGFVFDIPLETAKDDKKKLKTNVWGVITSIIVIIISVTVVVLVLQNNKSEDTSGSYKESNDVWNKDPNTWTEDEKDYVDGFWEWESKQQQKNK